MQTWSKSRIFKPKVYLTTGKPTSVDDALQQPQWKDAMTDEFLAFMRNETWILIPLPPD